jgi:hypothetical protein
VGEKRTRLNNALAAQVDPKPPSPLALAKLQNKASVLHRSFARKTLRFFNALDLERNC